MQLRPSETGPGRSFPGWCVDPDPGVAVSLQDVLMPLSDECDWIQRNELSGFDLFLVFFVWKSKQFSNYGKQAVLLVSQKQVYRMSRSLCWTARGSHCSQIPWVYLKCSVLNCSVCRAHGCCEALCWLTVVLCGCVSQILTMNIFS